MQKFTPKKSKSSLHVLWQASCPLLLKLGLATVISCQFIQSSQAQTLSPSKFILLSQSRNDASVGNENDSDSFKFEQYQQAFAEYDRASRLQPNDPTNWKKRGDALRNLGRYLEASNSYNQAILLNHYRPSYWENLGLSMYRRGFYQDAVDAYKKAIELNSDYGDYFNWLGNSLRELGNYQTEQRRDQDALNRYQEAIDAYNTALRLPRQFGNSEYLYNLSLALRQQGMVLDRLGKIEDAKKIYQEALNALDKSILLKPNSLRFYHRARFLIDLERYEEVLLILDKILKQSGDDINLRINPFDLSEAEISRVRISRVWHLKGVTLFRDKKYLEAAESFKQAIKLDSYSLMTKVDADWVKIDKDLDAYNSWFGLGLTLARLNRNTESLEAVNKAIELNPDYPEAIKLRDKLLSEQKE